MPSGSAAAPGPIWIRDIATNNPPFWVNSVAISSKGDRVLCGTFFHDYSKNSSSFGPNQPGTFCTSCYDATGKQLWTDTYSGIDGVFSVAVSGNGKVAAAGGWFDDKHGLLRVYDVATGKIVLDYGQIPKRVRTGALSNDGGVLAVAADHIYVFAKTGGKFPAAPSCIPFGPHDLLTSVAVHPSGKWIAACGKTGLIRVAELAKGIVTNVYEWQAPEGKLYPNDPNSKTAPMPFLAVEIARKSDAFIVGGGDMIYWSRSRKSLWRKGETSGHTQRVVEAYVDCDGDTLLIMARQIGGACHNGYFSCFYRTLDASQQNWSETESPIFDPESAYHLRAEK